MGYSTTDISNVKAQTIISVCGREIEEATQVYDLGFDMIKRLGRFSLARKPLTELEIACHKLWEGVKRCALGDNHRLYITFQNDDFVVIELK